MFQVEIHFLPDEHQSPGVRVSAYHETVCVGQGFFFRQNLVTAFTACYHQLSEVSLSMGYLQLCLTFTGKKKVSFKVGLTKPSQLQQFFNSPQNK